MESGGDDFGKVIWIDFGARGDDPYANEWVRLGDLMQPILDRLESDGVEPVVIRLCRRE